MPGRIRCFLFALSLGAQCRLLMPLYQELGEEGQLPVIPFFGVEFRR